MVLADPRLVAARELLGGALVKEAVARAQDLARSGAISPAEAADAAAAAPPPTAASLTPVINATGVLVHTNLGRRRCRRPRVTWWTGRESPGGCPTIAGSFARRRGTQTRTEDDEHPG